MRQTTKTWAGLGDEVVQHVVEDPAVGRDSLRQPNPWGSCWIVFSSPTAN